MPISPNVAAMMDGQSTDPVGNEFSSAFSQMAYDLFSQQLPEMLDAVVTFKILEAEPDQDFGVGTFILVYQGVPLYVPVILQNSELKPLELLYYKDADMFIPLSEDWIKQVVAKQTIEYGDPVTRPQDVPTDVNLEELITPPRTGRYVYASETFNLEEKPAAKQVSKIAQENNLSLDLIKDKLPAAYINKLASYIKTNVKILNKLAKDKKESFLDEKKVEKVASVPGRIEVLTLDSPGDVFEKIAKEDKKDLAKQIVQDGFVLKDNRDPETLGMTPIRIHGKFKCEQVMKGDFYQLFGKNGKIHNGHYFNRPLFIHGSDEFNAPQEASCFDGAEHKTVPRDGIFINSSKEPFKLYQNSSSNPVIGVIKDDVNYQEDLLSKIFGGAKDRPSVGEFGVFVNMETSPYTITEPTYIKEVTDDAGTTRIGISKYKPVKRTPSNESDNNAFDRQRSFEDENPDQIWLSDLKTAVQKYDKSGIVALSRKKFKWLPLKGVEDWGSLPNEGTFVTSPKFVEDFIATQIRERSGEKNKITKNDLGMFSLNGSRPLGKKEAALHVAEKCSIPADDALTLVKQAEKEKKAVFYLMDKKASIFANEAPQMAEAPMAQQEMPPEMMQEDAPEINPQFMDAAQNLDNQGLFNISTLLSLNKRQLVRNIFKDYFSTFKDALDALGRVLYTLWVKEPDLINELSLEGFQEIEDNVRLLFKGLGDLLLTTSKDSEILTL